MSAHKNPQKGKAKKCRPSASPGGKQAPASQKKEAAFLGWQQTRSGGMFPLYNIVKTGHPAFHSTVTDKTLHDMHLRIPRTPSSYPVKGPPPWHNVGIDLDDPPTATEAIEAAGLNYTVVKKPLREVMTLVNPDDETDSWATVRTDTGDVLGIVEADYEPV